MIIIELSEKEAFTLYTLLKKIVPIVISRQHEPVLKEFTDNLLKNIGIKYDLNDLGLCLTPCPHKITHKDNPNIPINVNSLLCNLCKYFIENDDENQIVICELSLE